MVNDMILVDIGSKTLISASFSADSSKGKHCLLDFRAIKHSTARKTKKERIKMWSR